MLCRSHPSPARGYADLVHSEESFSGPRQIRQKYPPRSHHLNVYNAKKSYSWGYTFSPNSSTSFPTYSFLIISLRGEGRIDPPTYSLSNSDYQHFDDLDTMMDTIRETVSATSPSPRGKISELSLL